MNPNQEKQPDLNKYVKYLINDLEEITKTSPKQAYIENPPGFEDQEYIVELALSPFRTFEEYTGIQQEAFPNIFDINMETCHQINQAILKVYKWLRLEITDLPKNLPADVLYNALRFNWDLEVQYLPSSGMDVDLCTGSEEICIYGKYCEVCYNDKIMD
jgi:hypothetical protein